MTTEKRPLQRVTARLFADTFEEVEKIASSRSKAEGKRVTYNEVMREIVETGTAVMRFEMNPTDPSAAAKLLNSNTTIAALGAFQHFSTTAQ